MEVLTLSLKQLAIYDQIKFTRKPPKAGRLLTLMEIRQNVWNYWHSNSQESTNTTNLARLHVTDKSHIQSGLEFVPTVSVTRPRNRLFYQSIRKTVQVTYKELYVEYIHNHEEQHHASWGIFLSLRPYSIKPNTSKEIEICCCNLHLHARWSIKAFVECCKLQKIDLHEITSYDTFFNHFTSSCLSDEVAYISWECCSDKTTLCNDIVKNWHSLKSFADKSNSNVTVPLEYFEKQLHVTKKRKAIKKDVNLEFLTAFIDKLLPKVVYHKNMLRH